MGSGPSRGKKVAPACVREVSVAETKRDGRPFKPLKIHARLRNARNRAQPDRHSEGPDSDRSDIDGELDTVMADECAEAERKTPPKKTFGRSRTYGLCHLSRGDTEEEASPAPRLREPTRAEGPRGSRCGSTDVNKRTNHAFTHCRDQTPASPSQHNGFLTRGSLLETVPTPGKQLTFGSCQSSSPTMPVILYDGSEEELMDTIEREFS